MEESFTSFLAITILLAVMAWIVIWTRTATLARTASVIVLIASVPISAGSMAYSLGYPMPIFKSLFVPAGDWKILGSKMVIDEGIFILLDTGGTPRHFVLPWDAETANKLQDLQDGEREGNNQGARMKIPPFEWSWERRKPLELYALPQEKVLPDKPREQAPKPFNSI